MKVIYVFYYISRDWDSDGIEDFIVEEIIKLGAFFDLKKGIEYYTSKYPSRKINYDEINVIDAAD